MSSERRNHYRILQVQPEAPPEVIKASYRALMALLHPDAGGDNDKAALLNAAYAVLSDPEQRRVYDQTLKRPLRAVAPTFLPTEWLTARVCPFCRQPFGSTLATVPLAGIRCARCEGPLSPAPTPQQMHGEIVGRRRGERRIRNVDARLHLPGEVSERPVRLRDLSLTGVSLISGVRIEKGTPLLLTADTFDAIALTVACRAASPVFGVHARLLTLQLRRGVTA